MFANKSDDPKTDRFVFLGSVATGIISAFFIYSYLGPYNLGYVSILPAIVSGGIVYILVGIVATVYLIHRKSLPKRPHKYKSNEIDDRWDTLEVAEK